MAPVRVQGAACHRRIPLRTGCFDVVLAPHMLYHVADRPTAAREMRRVLRPGGRCVIATNGAAHMRSLRQVLEDVVGRSRPGWEMQNPSTHVFSLENGAAQLGDAFASVRIVKPEGVPRSWSATPASSPTTWPAWPTTTSVGRPSVG